ncbi:hypothetical protein OAL44_00695 [Planctomycetaceae bacterium]|nr:hypothetical protein [Planctomycetaceae bacterium]
MPVKGVEVRLLSAALLLPNDLRRSGLPGRRLFLGGKQQFGNN